MKKSCLEKPKPEEQKKLSLIIPFYNEEEGVPHFIKQITPVITELNKSYQTETILVDDGSTDHTNELLHYYFDKNKNAKIVKHDRNRNLGAAIRTGFQNATGDIIATMDSDCTYHPQVIFELLKLLDEKTSIVTASPYHPAGKVENVPQYRLLLSKTVTLLYRLVTGAKIHTFTALFRVYKKDVVKNVQFKSNNFLATAEFLVYALRKGYKVKEYPTVLRVRKYGNSKMKLLLVIKSHASFLLKLMKLRLTEKLRIK